MAKAIIYSDEDVLAAQQALRSKTSRKVGKTRSQVAEFLADDIRKAIEQGYSLKDIKNILAEVGSPVFVVKMQKQYSFWGLNLLAMFDKNSPQAY